MKLIVGLGNPGPQYQNSRHNLGFMVLDRLAKEFLPLEKTKWRMDDKANALVLQVSPELILVKPQTFVNTSGFAVNFLITNYQLSRRAESRFVGQTTNLWIVHDDVDLPLGKLKIRFGGASAGHHGIESIMEKLGTDKFLRFRLGIGRPIKGIEDKNRSAKDVEEFVLEDFREDELGEVKNLITKTVKAIKVALKESPERAMNCYN